LKLPVSTLPWRNAIGRGCPTFRDTICALIQPSVAAPSCHTAKRS
jgi:hypothetical protein